MGSLPEGVTIREGGVYRRRDGELAGPMRLAHRGAQHPFTDSSGCTWAPCGRHDIHGVSDDAYDLVAEISEVVIDPLNLAAVLPTDSQARKDTPVYSGVLAYFPLALAEIARLSKAGNDKHNPGQPLHWSRGKSGDHADCIARHLLEIGTRDADDGHLHSTKLAWRALANLQLELENSAKGDTISS